MPRRKHTSSASTCRYPQPRPEALTQYLSSGGTIYALARHIMARPLLTSVAILQEEYEAGMTTHSQTPSGRKVTIDGPVSGIGGFLHPSYSRAVLVPSEARFDRVVSCAGILDSPEWLARRPLPEELSTEEAYALGRYYERVVEEFEEVAEEEGWMWVEELDDKWVAAVEAKATGPG